MLQPLKGISLGIVIEGLSGKNVIPFENNNVIENIVLDNLIKVADIVLQNVNLVGIKRTRPNEVGNDIEPYVKKALNQIGYKADTPLTQNGNKKSTGYPDIEFLDDFKTSHYLECKTFNIENIDTTQRSFYLSPSVDFKVTKDSHHFGISFEVYTDSEEGRYHIYKIKGWKILDLSELELDVKYEFNSDNKRLYNQKLILAQKEEK